MRGTVSAAFAGIASTLALHSLLSVDSVVTAAAAATPRINGWFPCHDSFQSGNSTPAPVAPFECAEVTVPLCHDGVCTSTKTINLFVKRLLAKKPTTPRKALWSLQGGPGYSSEGMESVMKIFSKTTSMTVDMYTVDHRGTGRSNYLECQAAQAFAAGSPDGVGVEYAEIPNCVKDILFQIDNHTEAFSVTSAAKDVEYLIDAINEKDAEVFVYGGSYGTYWGSRVMHLAPKKVKGYILDGVVDEGAATFTTWNFNRKYATARYLKACEDDKFCSSKLSKEIKAHGSLASAVRALYNRLDSAKPGTNKCADFAQSRAGRNEKPSYGLKNWLGAWIQSDPTRLVIPAIVHRFYMCRDKDVAFLKSISILNDDNESEGSAGSKPTSTPSPAVDMVVGDSEFLSTLVKASEMWTNPSPSWVDEIKSFENGLFSTSMSDDYGTTCFLRGDFSDPMCEHLIKESPEIDFASLKTTPYVYKPDKYWKKYATIPNHASVMVINGGLDFQTPQEWGTNEYEGLAGGSKILVNFDTGVHCAGTSRQIASDKSMCGYHIISSFVLAGGDVGKVNTTCIGKLPALDFADIAAIVKTVKVASADELYDSK